jgi:hypothetical protein
VRDIGLAPGLETEIETLGTAFLLKLGASLVTTLAVVIYAWIVHPNEPLIILIVAVISVASISQGFDVIDYFLQPRSGQGGVLLSHRRGTERLSGDPGGEQKRQGGQGELDEFPA